MSLWLRLGSSSDSSSDCGDAESAAWLSEPGSAASAASSSSTWDFSQAFAEETPTPDELTEEEAEAVEAEAEVAEAAQFDREAKDALFPFSHQEEVLHAAAVKLQARARGLAARAKVGALVRAKREAASLAALRLSSALFIQRCWRGCLVRRLEIARKGRLLSAVVTLQRCWRGTLARRECKKRRAAHARRLHALVTLQAWWRGALARRVCLELRRAAQTAAHEQKRRLHAAETLQRFWRGTLARLHFVELLRRHRAARQLQRVWRGVSLRARMRSAFADILADCDEAAAAGDDTLGIVNSAADFVVWDPEAIFQERSPAASPPLPRPLPPPPPPSQPDTPAQEPMPPFIIKPGVENAAVKETWGGTLSEGTAGALAQAARRTRVLHARHAHEARMADPLARAAAIAAKVGAPASPERRRPSLSEASPERWHLLSPPAPRPELAALPAHLFEWDAQRPCP